MSFWLAIPPTSYRGLSGPESVPEDGASEGVSHRVSQRPFGLRTAKKVSQERLLTVFDAPGTLSGHFFGHSRAWGPKGLSDTPWDTFSGTPVFGDTPGTPAPEAPKRTLQLVGGIASFGASCAVLKSFLSNLRPIPVMRPIVVLLGSLVLRHFGCFGILGPKLHHLSFFDPPEWPFPKPYHLKAECPICHAKNS